MTSVLGGFENFPMNFNFNYAVRKPVPSTDKSVDNINSSNPFSIPFRNVRKKELFDIEASETLLSETSPMQRAIKFTFSEFKSNVEPNDS